MAEEGIIKGVGNGQFMPSRHIKEIEVIAMILRVAEAEDKLSSNAKLPDDFEGDTPQEWMIPYIALAEEEDLLSSDDLKKFNPNSSASREEVAKYVWLAIKDLNLDLADGIDGDFEDEEFIGSKYQYSVRMLKELGLMEGYKNKFQPNKPMTRAECAVLMNRIFDYEFDFELGNHNNEKPDESGILRNIDYEDNTTLEAITIDIDDDDDYKDGIELDSISKDIEILVANNCCNDDNDVLDDIDDNKYLGLKVDVYFDDEGDVERIFVYYDELKGVLDTTAVQEYKFSHIIPSKEYEDEYGDESKKFYFNLDRNDEVDMEIFMNCEAMTADDFDDDDNDFKFHDEFEYIVDARFDLDDKDEIIQLCITSEYEGELTEYDNSDLSRSITIDIALEDESSNIVKFDISDDFEMDSIDLKNSVGIQVEFKVNGENEVIELDLD
jgi:hypothetical protein